MYQFSQSFEQTLAMRQDVRAEWERTGQYMVHFYPTDSSLMEERFDNDRLGIEAARRLRAAGNKIAGNWAKKRKNQPHKPTVNRAYVIGTYVSPPLNNYIQIAAE